MRKLIAKSILWLIFISAWVGVFVEFGLKGTLFLILILVVTFVITWAIWEVIT